MSYFDCPFTNKAAVLGQCFFYAVHYMDNKIPLVVLTTRGIEIERVNYPYSGALVLWPKSISDMLL